jgi:hypothetical protein
MTRKNSLALVVVVLAVALAVVGRTAAGGATDASTMTALTDQIDAQIAATQNAIALANDVWVPRIAGLGLGLAVGLLVGGVGAYKKWGDGQ